MKIGMREVNEGIYLVAERKLCRSLEKEGFIVRAGHDEELYDVYAEKNGDKRVYVLKIGKNKVQQRLMVKLQEYAKSIDARLFVTYLQQPKSKNIEYLGIENMLLEYIENNMPNELDTLSTHTIIQYVNDVEIDSISINENSINAEGNATLSVQLIYGSQSDNLNGDGDSIYDSFDFLFRVKVIDERIDTAYLKFDLEHFYE